MCVSGSIVADDMWGGSCEQTALVSHRSLGLVREVRGSNFIKISGSQQSSTAGNFESKLIVLTQSIIPTGAWEGGLARGRYLRGYKNRHDGPSQPVCRSDLVSKWGRPRKSFIFIHIMMSSISFTQVFLLLALLYLTASLPVRDEDEGEDSLTGIRLLNTPWSFSGTSAEALLEARFRHLLSSGLDRRRQLGDIEFSNRYSEYLRSKAKHNSMCALLRRMQGVKKSGVGGDVEKVNQLLKQYMCSTVYNNWPIDL